jgi:hypothetical protein
MATAMDEFKTTGEQELGSFAGNDKRGDLKKLIWTPTSRVTTHEDSSAVLEDHEY